MTMPKELSRFRVTLAAVNAYARARRCTPDEAREEMERYMLGAKLRSDEPGKPALYRHRSRASQLDITARVVRDGNELVVVSVTVRDFLR